MIDQKLARQIAQWVGVIASVLQIVIDFGLPGQWNKYALALSAALALFGTKFPGTVDKTDLEKLAAAEQKKLASLRPPSLAPTSVAPAGITPSVATQPIAILDPTLAPHVPPKDPGTV